MITSIRPYNINYNYRPQFTANRKEYTASVSYEDVTEDLLNDLVEEWDEEDLIYDGDSLFIMPLNHIREAAKFDKKIAKTFPKANLSKNGFAVTLIDQYGRIHTKALRYYDPRVITILRLTNALKNNGVSIIPISEIYE